MEPPRSPPRSARLNDVIPKMIAITAVILPSTVGVALGLGHELVDVLGLDAATVEDPDALSDLLRRELREQTAQVPVDLAGLGRRRVDARPDGPDRLVGEDDLPKLCGRHAGEPGAQLALHRREGKSLAPLLGGLADAEDGREALGQRRAEL